MSVIKNILKLESLFLMFQKLKYKKSHSFISKNDLNTQPCKVKQYTNLDWMFPIFWYIAMFGIVICGIKIGYNLFNKLGVNEVLLVMKFASFTAIRVILLVLLATIIWVPIGIYIGLNSQLNQKIQPIIQICASIPSNILFPVFVIGISTYNLNPDIWLSFLMIIGTQWYILFNVIAGSMMFPNDMREVALNFNIKGKLYAQKIIIPAISPSLITGMITASGGAWNASIISEFVHWGDTKISAQGIGSYITQNAISDNSDKIMLGVIVMCAFVVVINKILWQPLYDYVTQKYQL
jgi:NitT/TauT family transport system permease protein